MQIIYSIQGKEAVFDREMAQVVIGRSKAGVTVDLDLSPDGKVSRPHARIWKEMRTWAKNDQFWIEDLDSTHGTQINGEEIKGKGKQRLLAGDTIQIGDTTLRVQIQPEQEEPFWTRPLDNGQLLYAWLDTFLIKNRGSDTAEEKLEKICQQLVKFAQVRGFRDAEDLAQRVSIVVVKKVREVVQKWDGKDPALYFYGIWKNIRREAIRKADKENKLVSLEEDKDND